MKLTCADPACERAPMRTRDDKRYCMFHPDETAPDVDQLTGKLREPEKAKPLRKAASRTATAYRAPGRVVEVPQQTTHADADQLVEQLRAPGAATDPLPDGAARLKTLLLLPIDQVLPHPLNVRDGVGDLRDLIASIKQVGILEPLVASPHRDGFRLIAGHRRLAAAKSAGQTHVPVVVRRDLTDRQVIEAMLVENMQRVDLTPLEQARALKGLVALGRSQREIAKAIGKSEHFVSTRLLLLELPADIQGRLTAKEISPKEAVAIARHLRGTNGVIHDNGWAKPHFYEEHPLANAARTTCEALGHNLRRRVGRVACGECWETVIRNDERRQDGAA